MTSPAPQQTPVIRSVHWATGSQENATITTTAETAVGDVLIAVHGADWDTAADLTTPTGTAGTWRYNAVADRGTNATKIKMYDRKVTVKGAQKVTVNYGVYSDVILIVIVLDGSTVNPDAYYDGWAGNTGAASVNHVAASVTPAGGTADLLFTAHATSDSGNSGKSVAAYTRPTAMMSVLRQGSSPSQFDYVSSDEWLSLGVFTQSLASGAATGTGVHVTRTRRSHGSVPQP